MTQVPLPEPAGIVVGEERGYSDWFHIIRWDCSQNMPKGTKFFLEEGLHEFAAVVSAAKDAEIERLREEVKNTRIAYSKGWGECISERNALSIEVERLRKAIAKQGIVRSPLNRAQAKRIVEQSMQTDDSSREARKESKT